MFPQFLGLRANSRKRWVREGGKRQIVEPDHCDILRDRKAGRPNCRHRPKRDCIVTGKQGGGNHSVSQDFTHRVKSAFATKVADRQKLLVESDSRFLQSFAIPLESSVSRQVRKRCIAYMGNAAVTK